MTGPRNEPWLLHALTIIMCLLVTGQWARGDALATLAAGVGLLACVVLQLRACAPWREGEHTWDSWDCGRLP